MKSNEPIVTLLDNIKLCYGDDVHIDMYYEMEVDRKAHYFRSLAKQKGYISSSIAKRIKKYNII